MIHFYRDSHIKLKMISQFWMFSFLKEFPILRDRCKIQVAHFLSHWDNSKIPAYSPPPPDKIVSFRWNTRTFKIMVKTAKSNQNRQKKYILDWYFRLWDKKGRKMRFFKISAYPPPPCLNETKNERFVFCNDP